MLHMTENPLKRLISLKQLVKPHIMPVLLLIAVAFALYGKAIGHEFLINWDDNLCVTGNPDIMGFSAEHLRHAFTKYYVCHYAPLQIISYMLDYTLWGLNATGFKLTNIILHAFNTLLYYALLVRITGRRLLAMAAAAIFLCHPVQVESVVWISQRKNLLAMFFFLIAFLTYLSWKERRHFGYYFFSLAAFTLALLSKSVVVVLPLILFCYDFCFLKRETLWRMVRDKLPYIFLAAVCATLALFSQQIGGGRMGHLGGSMFITLLNMLPVFSRYLIHLLIPVHLSVIYNGSIKTAPDVEIVLSALLVILLMGSWVYLYRRNRGLFFWSSLFIIGLLPVSNIIPTVTFMNDRYLYFPMLGFAAFIAHLPVFEYESVYLRRVTPLRTFFVAVLLFLSVAAWKRIDVWRDAYALWNDAVMSQQDGTWYNYNPNYENDMFAEVLCNRGFQAKTEIRFHDSIYFYLKALSYDPTSRNALYHLNDIFIKLGRPLAGRPYIIRMTEIYQFDDNGYACLGYNYELTGELDKAEQNLRRALKINPANKLSLSTLDRVLKKRGALKIKGATKG